MASADNFCKQYGHFVRPDLDPNCLTLMVFLIFFFLQKVENQQMTKNMQNYPGCKELNKCLVWSSMIEFLFFCSEYGWSIQIRFYTINTLLNIHQVGHVKILRIICS